jgi:hypothetical protein
MVAEEIFFSLNFGCNGLENFGLLGDCLSKNVFLGAYSLSKDFSPYLYGYRVLASESPFNRDAFDGDETGVMDLEESVKLKYGGGDCAEELKRLILSDTDVEV